MHFANHRRNGGGTSQLFWCQKGYVPVRNGLGILGAVAAAVLLAATSGLPIRAQDHSPTRATAQFETVSVKPATGCSEGSDGPRLGISTAPGRLSIRCQTVDFLIRQAYLANGRDPLFVSTTLFGQPLQGSPAWIRSERYAIDARAGRPANRETMLGSMMQALLEDRFKLKIHRQTKEVQVYELTVARGGPKLQAAKEGNCVAVDPEKRDPPRGTHSCGVLIRSVNPSVPTALYGATMADLSRGLSRPLDRDVIDRTGITGVFDIQLELSPADLFPLAHAVSSDPNGPVSASDPSGSSIFRAIQKLGLKLESGKAPAEFLVIDHVERPSRN